MSASKPTPAQVAALRLAARDAIRYYKGGAYMIPADAGDCQRTWTQRFHAAPLPGTTPQTLRACTARGWLDAITLPNPPAATVYDHRWTLTDAGRAVLDAATKEQP